MPKIRVMRQSRFPKPFYLILLLWMAVAGCDGGSDIDVPDIGDDVGGYEDTGGGGGRDEPRTDTLGYAGRLTWSKTKIQGVFVWDLPTSELVFEAYEPDEPMRWYSDPTLSADGSTFAYTKRIIVGLNEFLGSTVLRNLTMGEEVSYSDQGVAANARRLSFSPSLSADGSRVAISEQYLEWADTEREDYPLHISNRRIQVWDRNTDTLIQVTDGTFRDVRPQISDDGKRVFFLSDRDETGLDFYIANVEDHAEVGRISFKASLKVNALSEMDEPGRISLSGDLRWLAFVASVKAADEEVFRLGYFLMDTTTGSVQELNI